VAHVLVVDARSATRDLVARLLADAGHSVVEAEEGHGALEVARSERPDVVIMGILTPRMDGPDLVRRLRADPAVQRTRVVFFTPTYMADHVRDLCDACGIAVSAADLASPAAKGTPVRRVDRHLRLLSHRLLEKDRALEEARRSRSRLLADLVQAEEAERTRIAWGVHDDSIQVMSAAALRLDALAGVARSEQGEAIGEVADKVRQAVVRLRALTFDLTPPSTAGAGLGPAIESYMREVGADAGFRSSVEDRLNARPPAEVEAVLYPIAREAIRNARKHARAHTVTVTLREHDGGTLLRIEDDGVGFVVEHRPGHLGQRSMRERAAAAGGSLQLQTAPGAGCGIEVWVPHSVPSPALPSSGGSLTIRGDDLSL